MASTCDNKTKCKTKKKHDQNQEDKEPEHFKCKICNKMYVNQQNLFKHEKIHENDDNDEDEKQIEDKLKFEKEMVFSFLYQQNKLNMNENVIKDEVIKLLLNIEKYPVKNEIISLILNYQEQVNDCQSLIVQLMNVINKFQ